MELAPLAAQEAGRLLDLARRDRGAAEEAIGKLSPEAQVALVCETPLARRSEMLSLVPEPEAVIPELPEAELCFTVKAVGLADAAWILEHATTEQTTAAIDLDAWRGTEPDLATLSEWVDALVLTPRPNLLRHALALDTELLVALLRSRVGVMQRPSDDESWQPPAGGLTVEGDFYYWAFSDGDDLESVTTLLRTLFEGDYWSYFRLMQGVLWELDSDNQEWALRWRTGRLQDLGFPPWDDAVAIYRFIGPDDRAKLAEDSRPLDVEAWRLPIWLPRLPATGDGQARIFDAIARLDDGERSAFFFAFLALANKIAVADGLPLGDAESTPIAIAKAARFASDGLCYIAEGQGLEEVDVLRRANVEHLFRVGANLDPESARPR